MSEEGKVFIAVFGAILFFMGFMIVFGETSDSKNKLNIVKQELSTCQEQNKTLINILEKKGE